MSLEVGLAGIDKLDIRVNTLVPLRSEFQQFLDEIRHRPKELGFHQSEHYAVVGSLEPMGIDGQFHGWLRHRNKANREQSHKVELNDVGLTGKSRIFADLERIVACDPTRLEPMRIDLCADIPDVPVSFFHRHMRIALKRRGARVTEFEHIYQGEGETVYFGKRPNCFRVYNKIAELKFQHKRSIRRAARERDAFRQKVKRYAELTLVRSGETLAIPPVCYCDPDEGNCDCFLEKQSAQEWPTFEETFERKETDVLTRIERQIAGRQVPFCASTLAKLDHLPEFNPFRNVQMIANEAAQLPGMHSRFNFPQYHCGLWLRQMQQGNKTDMDPLGLDYVRNYIRTFVGKGNAAETFELYKPFLESIEHGIRTVTPEQIYESYRDSVTRQLAA